MKRLAGALMAAAVLLTGCAETSADGSVIYTRACSACHGADLSGSVGPALDAGSEAARESDAAYRMVIRQGTSGMSANTSLSEAQLDALIAYIRRVQGQESAE